MATPYFDLDDSSEESENISSDNLGRAPVVEHCFLMRISAQQILDHMDDSGNLSGIATSTTSPCTGGYYTPEESPVTVTTKMKPMMMLDDDTNDEDDIDEENKSESPLAGLSDGTEYYSSENDSLIPSSGELVNQKISKELEEKQQKVDELTQQINIFKEERDRAVAELGNLESQISDIQQQRNEQMKIIEKLEQDIKLKRKLVGPLRELAEEILPKKLSKKHELLKTMSIDKQNTQNRLTHAHNVSDQIKVAKTEMVQSINHGLNVLHVNDK